METVDGIKRLVCCVAREVTKMATTDRIKAICTRPNSIIVDKAEPGGIFDLPDP